MKMSKKLSSGLRMAAEHRLYSDCDCAYAIDKVDTENWVGSCDKCVYYFKLLQMLDEVDKELDSTTI